MKTNMVLQNGVYVNVTDAEYKMLQKAFTFTNPEYVQKTRMGLFNWETPKKISFLEVVKEDKNNTIVRIPRNYYHLGVDIDPDTYYDRRSEGKKKLVPGANALIKKITLHPWQQEATESYLMHVANDHSGAGIVSLACGKGKTVTAINIMALTGLQTLILVDQVSLASQWAKEIKEKLDIEPAMWIQDKNEIGIVTIATLQSLRSHKEAGKLPKDFFDNFGLAVLDECHVAPAWTFHDVMMSITSKYVLGLSATTKRVDGLEDIMFSTCGSIVYTDLSTDLTPDIQFKPIKGVMPKYRKSVWFVNNKFNGGKAEKVNYLKRITMPCITELTESPERNKIIVEDIIADVKLGHKCLVLTGRKEHARLLEAKLKEHNLRAASLISLDTAKRRTAVIDAMKAGELDVLVATSLAKKGLDMPSLSSLFLTTPNSSEEFNVQSVGRILRVHPDKLPPKVTDYVDVDMQFSFYMGMARLRIYNEKKWKHNARASKVFEEAPEDPITSEI